MSAAYDAAGKALGVVDEVVHEEPDSVPTSTYALLGIGRALLALTDEVEQVVELLRTLVDGRTVEVVQHASGPVLSCTGREDCAGPVHVRGCLATAPPDPRYPPMRTS